MRKFCCLTVLSLGMAMPVRASELPPLKGIDGFALVPSVFKAANEPAHKPQWFESVEIWWLSVILDIIL